jgi:anti-sigma regulatory factor (Ser/Thr protein kinase)
LFEISRRAGREAVLERDANRVGSMRRIARAFIAYHGLGGLDFVVSLIVSELVTNAVLHSRGRETGFVMSLRGDRLYIAVRNDVMTVVTTDQGTSVDDEHGRGLQLVAFAVGEAGGTWGVEGDGRTVACHLPVEGASR